MKWKRFAVSLVVGLLGVSGLLWVLAEFHEEIAEPFLRHLDLQIQSVVHGFTSPGLTKVMLGLTWIGSPTVVFVFSALIALWLWWRRLLRDAVTFVTAIVGAVILMGVLKAYFHRMRPDVPWALTYEHSFSFPSGHSVLAVVLYGSLLCMRFRHLRHRWERWALSAVAVGLIGGIGLSRIYLGVHYPSDVAAGYLVGCVWLATVMVAEWGVQEMDRLHDLSAGSAKAITE